MLDRPYHVLVTGGAGFVGSHLCEALIGEGCHVACLDDFTTGSIGNLEHLLPQERLTILRQDVIAPLPADLPRFDEIYHLACPASPVHYQADPVATLRTCAEGTYRMLERARRDGARLFHASTSEVYGDPLVHPQVEDYTGNVHTIGPRACYDEGKRFAESLVSAYALQHDVDAKIARLFNTYGPRMQARDGRVISNFVTQALTGEELTVFGDGTHTRSLCYVDDTVAGILLLARSSVTSATPVNLGNPHEMQVVDIAERVIAATGSSSRIAYRPLPLHDPLRRLPDIGRAMALLDWRPHIGIDEGLARTIAWFEEHVGRNDDDDRLAAGG